MYMRQYHDLLSQALSGERRTDERTGAGTVGVYQRQARFDLNKGFPIATTKRIGFKTIAKELFWFLSGSDNIRPLVLQNVSIWSSDALRSNLDYVIRQNVMAKEEVADAQEKAKTARKTISDTSLPLSERKPMHDALMAPAYQLLSRYEERIKSDEEFASVAGKLGPSYGPQWRGTNGAQSADQIRSLEDALRKGGSSRRMIVAAWNSLQADKVALPPCHVLYQAHVSPETNALTLGWYQRSCDTILGVPFNITSYGLLTELLAHTHGFEKGELIGTFADLHVYIPHIPAAKEQLKREPGPLPKLVIKTKKDSVADYTITDVFLDGYCPHEKLENPTPMYGGFF